MVIGFVINRVKFKRLKSVELNSIRHILAGRKTLVVETFQDLCGTGLFTLQFHLLHHQREDLDHVHARCINV